MKYLIKDTTKEERMQLVKKAFGIAIADNQVPTDTSIELVQKYINGEMELEQVKQKIIQIYNKN